MSYHLRNIFYTVAQWRQPDASHAEAVEKVFSELPLPHADFFVDHLHRSAFANQRRRGFLIRDNNRIGN